MKALAGLDGSDGPDDERAAPSLKPDEASGLNWGEFFHELGRGPEVSEQGGRAGTNELVQERTLYLSENGDSWSLVLEAATARVFVRHKPNASSGGRASDMDVGEFLVRGGMGPEKQELLRLIGSIVDRAEARA